MPVGGVQVGALCCGDVVGVEAAAEDVVGVEVVKAFGGVILGEDARGDAVVFDAQDVEQGALGSLLQAFAQVGDVFGAVVFDFQPDGGGAGGEVVQAVFDGRPVAVDAGEGLPAGDGEGIDVRAAAGKGDAGEAFFLSGFAEAEG